jgi:glycosyltransferase involved in cell wall biosynthesis
MEQMRHVLIVSYDFPRISAAGVIRTYQFAKRLSEFGWRPIILTTEPCGNSYTDDIEASDGELPCPKVTVRTGRSPALLQISQPGARGFLNEAVQGKGRLSGLGRLAAQLAVPDGKIRWLLPAVRRGVQIARQYPLEACLSVSPRPTTHFVAYKLARRLNIPWVADFALPWSDAYWLNGRPRFVERLDRKLEKLVVRFAGHVTVAYAEIARSLSARYGVAEEKISVIPTGFEDELFTGPGPKTAAKLTVIYAGNHFCEEGRHGECFLTAIDEWIDLNPSLEKRVEFVFLGKRDEDLLRQWAKMAHRDVIRVAPFTSHRACIQAILASQMCVVNAVGNRIPAKVYEYMRAGKWILALTTPGSDLAGLVNRYPKGMVVAAQNTSAIREALQNIWRRCPAGTVESMQADGFLCSHSASHSAELLAVIFNRLLKKHELIKRQIQSI